MFIYRIDRSAASAACKRTYTDRTLNGIMLNDKEFLPKINDLAVGTGTGVQGKRFLGVRSGKILRGARAQGGHVEYKYYSENLQRRSMAINSIYKIEV